MLDVIFKHVFISVKANAKQIINDMSRIAYIDWVKVVGIWLIVFGHVPITNAYVHQWVFSFHVPLFFFISGFLYRYKDDRDFYWPNFRNLVLVAIMYFFVGKIGTLPIALQHESFSQFGKNAFQNLLLLNGSIGPVWFLISLFWMRLAYHLLDKLKIGHLWVLFISFIIATGVICVDYSSSVYQIGSFFIGFPFFAIGKTFREFGILEKIKTVSLWLSLPLLALSIALCWSNGMVDINAMKYGNNPVLFYLCAMAGILFLFILLSKLKKNNIVEVISNGTLVILGTHMILVQAFKLMYKEVRHINYPPPIHRFGIRYNHKHSYNNTALLPY